MNSPARAYAAHLARRWSALCTLRADNFTALRHFLEGHSRPARMVNMCFNLACKTGRGLVRAVRCLRHTCCNTVQPCMIGNLPPCDEVPPLHNRCALIADMFLPQCRHYRVTERAAQLRHLGWLVDTCSWRECDSAMQALQLASCVIFYRVPMTDHVPALFAEARRLKLPILFDIDDLVFDRTLYAEFLSAQALDSAEVKGLLDLADMFRASMDASDILLTSTRVLAEHVGALAQNRQCFVVHNSIARTLEAAASALHGRPARNDDEVRMFYGSGSKTHDADFALIADAVLQAMHDNTHLHLYLHGYLELPPNFADCGGRVHRIAFMDKEAYFRAIADYDIALMPLEDSLFNEAKSNIKYQEASVYGIPSIVSPRTDFLEAVTDGENALVAHTPAQWHKAILQLAASAELRRAMGEKARQTVLSRYASCQVAEAELRPVLPICSATGATRVLLLNVFFGKSSFGGATMVAEDTARELRRRGFDVYVFSTVHLGNAPVGRLVRYGWEGINVIAAHDCLNGAEEQNETMERLFRQTLHSIKPDIVHIHCIQGMGLGLVLECGRMGIPYLITMHDAWWICPRQFMMDKAEQYCAQQEVRPEICRARCDLPDAFLYHRRRIMHEAVRQAKAIFAPSAFYTDFVRRNFPYEASKVRINRNGIHSAESPRPPRKAGPIRFGFLGGKAYHKGYYFLAEALHTLGRTDFELVLVDLHTALGTDSVNKERYADISQGIVTHIVPFVSHKAIDSLYAQFDVLLFPSLWDESFGLIVREAIVRDIFVITADCGGPSEAIVHGENGFVFPKGDIKAFTALLHHILDQQEEFIAYRTLTRGDVIDAGTQALELAAAYQRIIQHGVL